MSFDWKDQSVQRAFVYGCFESKQLAETAVELIKKHATVDTPTVHAWYQEFRAIEQISERRGRRETEEDSETNQPDAKRFRLGPTTDMGDSNALTKDIKKEVDNVEDFIAAPNTAETMNLTPTSLIKVEVYEDCHISELVIYLNVDYVTIKKKLMYGSCLARQKIRCKTEDPTQYSFIHRAISEVESIFNTPNLKLNAFKIIHNIDENGVTEEKKRTFYDGFQQMMAKLSEKLHLRNFEIFVESPEVLIGFLKTMQPQFLKQLNICNPRESFDMSQVVLLEHWPKLEIFFSDDYLNIPLSKLAHIRVVIASVTELTTNEREQYFSILTEMPTISHSFLIKHPILEAADFSGTLQRHKLCESRYRNKRCYLLTDGSVISVASYGCRLDVKKRADLNSLYVNRCYCD